MRTSLVLAALGSATLFAQTPPTAYTPLTAGERWEHYWNETFLSPGLYFAAFGAASGAQLANDPPEWGQGFKGYSHRTGSLFATFTIQATVHEAASAALHYDPRYLRCHCQGGGRRLRHAVVWSLLTKNDEGQTRFDLPVLAGAYASGIIPILWYPDRYSPWKDGFRLGSQQLGFSVGVNVIKEFGPELRRIFRPKGRSTKSSH